MRRRLDAILGTDMKRTEPAAQGRHRFVDASAASSKRIGFKLNLDREGQAHIGLKRVLEVDFAVRPNVKDALLGAVRRFGDVSSATHCSM